MITVESILARLPAIVGEPIDRRWKRASLTLRGSDGQSREGFFNGFSLERRLRLVSDKLASGAPWSPLLMKTIAKGYSKAGTRPICWATCVDTAIVYALTDAIEPHIEEKLSDVAIAYRSGRRMTDSIISAVSRARSRNLTVVSVADIKSFFDSIPWKLLDDVIDDLPLDEQVKSLLKQLVRVEVRHVENGAVVQRNRGIPQGLGISAMLANLCLAEFDKNVTAACGKLGCILRRYADDVILFAPSAQAGERASELVRTQLGSLSLRLKKGTGEAVDLAVEGTSATWLGIKLSGHPTTQDGSTVIKMDIPASTIESKAGELRGELDAGLTTMSDIKMRLRDLERYWGSLVPPHQARMAVRRIHDRIMSLDGMSPAENLKTVIAEIDSDKTTKKEVLKNQRLTIEELIYPSTRTLRTTWEEDGKKETRRIALRAGRRVEINKWKKETLSGGCPMAPQRPTGGHRENKNGVKNGGSFSRSTPRVSDGENILSIPIGTDGDASLSLIGGSHPSEGTSAVGTLTGLELQRPDPRVSDGREGVPSSPHPLRLQKRVVVRAEARGAKAVVMQVDVDGARAPWCKLKVPESNSTAEAVLYAFEMGLRKLVLSELTDVQLVTTEPTIRGYVEKGWRVGSFEVLRRLRALQRVAEIEQPGESRRP